MANKVLIKKSTVPGKIPLASDLDIGELALNTNDAVLYTKHSDDSIKLLKAEPILPDVVSVGTYTKVTTDSKGRVVSGTTLSSTDIPLLSISKTDGLQAAINLKASLDSPSFTGYPTVPNPDTSDNSNRIATTEFVRNTITAINIQTGNYGGWSISDGDITEFVSSGSVLNMVGDGITSVSYDTSNNTITVSSSIPTDVINSIRTNKLYALAGL